MLRRRCRGWCIRTASFWDPLCTVTKTSHFPFTFQSQCEAQRRKILIDFAGMRSELRTGKAPLHRVVGRGAAGRAHWHGR